MGIVLVHGKGVSDRPAEKSLRPDLQDLPLAFFEKVCK